MNIKAHDGVELFVRDWPLPADARRRGAALIVHGIGEHCGRYAHVAAALNAIGVAVCGYDHRGFGQSGGPRATIPRRDALLEDATLVFEEFAAEARAAGDASPPFLIGHSMGGAIAARAVTGGWISPRGLVLSSPGLKTYLPRPAQWLIRAAARLVPNVARPHGLPLGKISHDAQVLLEAESDPHCHDIATPRLIAFVLDAGAHARRDAAKLRTPTLLLVAGDDGLVDPGGSRAFADAAPAQLVTFRWYETLYHEIFNEAEPHRTRVLGDLCDWIAKQTEAGAA